jgi:hypothetical protein
MYYTEMLRARKGLLVLSIVLAVITGLVLVTLAVNLGIPVGHINPPGFPVVAIFAIAGFIAALYTFSMCTGLSAENDGHLPLAWTKPVSRVRLGLSVLAVDVAGIICAYLIANVFIFLIVAAIGALKYMTITPDVLPQLFRFALFPLGYFGIIVAGSAMLGKGGRGVSWGTWGASWFVATMALINLPPPWNQLFRFLNIVNPAVYATYSHATGGGQFNVGISSSPTSSGWQQGLASSDILAIDISALAALCVAGAILALIQWRRLEA